LSTSGGGWVGAVGSDGTAEAVAVGATDGAAVGCAVEAVALVSTLPAERQSLMLWQVPFVTPQ